MEDWNSVFAANPQILWSVLADVVKAAKVAEDQERTGRRPAASVASMDELRSLLFADVFCGEEFPYALKSAMRSSSTTQRALAMRTGINQSNISRMCSGQQKPTLQVMELLAGALRIKPTWFAEYRAEKLGQIVSAHLSANPAASAAAARRIFEAEVTSGRCS